MEKQLKIKIKINEISQIQQFNRLISRDFLGLVDVCSVNNRYIVDGSSFLGLLSLDLSKEIYVILHTDNLPEVLINQFIAEMRQFEEIV